MFVYRVFASDDRWRPTIGEVLHTLYTSQPILLKYNIVHMYIPLGMALVEAWPQG